MDPNRVFKSFPIISISTFPAKIDILSLFTIFNCFNSANSIFALKSNLFNSSEISTKPLNSKFKLGSSIISEPSNKGFLKFPESVMF